MNLRMHLVLIVYILSFYTQIHGQGLRFNGSSCPVPMRYNVSCPPICVSQLSDCPLSLIPTCPQDQVYCSDGQCRSSCSGVKSLCSCQYGFDTPLTFHLQGKLLPCKLLKTDVPNYAQNDVVGDAPLLEKCSQITNQSFNGSFILKCKPRPVKYISAMDTEFIVIYVIVTLEILLLISYDLYRRFMNRRHVSFKSNFVSQASKFFVISDKESPSSIDNSRVAVNSLKMSGYKRDLFGSVAFLSIIGMSFFLIAILIVLVCDYYGLFSGLNYKDRSMLLIDQPTLSIVFVIVWHLTTIWFLTLKIQSDNLLTYFLKRAHLHSADYILIEKKLDTQAVLQGLGPIVTLFLGIEKYFKLKRGDVSLSLVTVSATKSQTQYIEFECVRYIYDLKSEQYIPVEWPIGHTVKDLNMDGLTTQDARNRYHLVGPNTITHEVDSFWSGFKKEFTGIFYIYQMMQIIIWYYYAYYYMALVVNLVILFTGIAKVFISIQTQKQIVQIAKFYSRVRVLRDGKWIVMSSTELVPGDVFEVNAFGQALPVDCFLISGSAVVDESSLTGEALPIAKFPMIDEIDSFTNNHTIFAGCRVLEAKPSAENGIVQGYVIATGASTAKGSLVRDILFPVPFKFIFTEHLKVVISMLFVWGIALLFVSMIMLKSHGTDSWFYGMTCISQVLSPLLPAVLIIGQSIATERLRKKGILCMDLNRITLAGKVKFFCFDKTGTLTKKGLDYVGNLEVLESRNLLGDVNGYFESLGDTFKRIMMTCHSLSTVSDRYVGNFVDIEMFRVTNAKLISVDGSLTTGDLISTVLPCPHSGVPPLKIMKKFDFCHKNAYMSVIVKDTSTGKLFLYLKGSFDKIKEKVVPESLPFNYENIVKYHSAKGYYIIATAAVELPSGTSAEVAARWPREFLERNACFIGLLLFRNEVKPDTALALNDIRKGGCRVNMITGDNVNTAIYIGWTSGMIRKDWQKQDPLIVIGDVKDDQVVWMNSDDDSILPFTILETLILRSKKGFRPIEIAITGKAFHKLVQDGWLQKNILHVRIFAGMKPLDKVKCIRLHMEKGITAMCGDGGNDAGALKAAHTGIALSDTDSSVVGHFSSKSRSITSCVELLKEARCSLDVSFASYKYLMMYGEILAFIGIAQFVFRISMSQAMYILIDASTVPLSWALSIAMPTKKLAESRPTAKLLGLETVASIVGQIFIDAMFMIIAVCVLMAQPFYECHSFDDSHVDLSRWWQLADNFEAQVISLMLIFQIFHSAAALNLGWKYRQGSLRNWKFVLIYMSLIAILCVITVSDPNSLGCLFRINCGTKDALETLGYKISFEPPLEYYSSFGHNVMPVYFRWIILLIVTFNLLALLLWEGIIVQGSFRIWFLKKFKTDSRMTEYKT